MRRRHAVPNALLPTITLVFLNIGFVVSGRDHGRDGLLLAGLGLLTYQALRGPDVPLLQALFLLFSLGGRSSPTSSPTSWSPPSTRGCAT